jgi:methylase of polypeptide subunit release factors
LLYSKLLTEGCLKAGNAQLLLDLGTGSGIPLFSALLKSKTNIRAIGVDNDSFGLQIARENLRLFPELQQIELVHADISTFLQNHEADLNSKSVLLCSNPPYLPCPEGLASEYDSVNGGRDGTFFLEILLTQSYSPSSILAIQWGSVSNPEKIFSIIKQGFEIEYLQACELPFGKYSVSKPINGHLHDLRTKSKSAFFGPVGGDQSQLVFGALLRPKTKDLH